MEKYPGPGGNQPSVGAKQLSNRYHPYPAEEDLQHVGNQEYQEHSPYLMSCGDMRSSLESGAMRDSCESADMYSSCNTEMGGATAAAEAASTENMSEAHSAYSTDNMMYDEYVQEEEEEDRTGNPNTSVLCRLDRLLREKVNLEVEEFRNSLHEILNNQLHLVDNLLKMSQSRREGSSQESSDRGTALGSLPSASAPLVDSTGPCLQPQTTENHIHHTLESATAIYQQQLADSHIANPLPVQLNSQVNPYLPIDTHVSTLPHPSTLESTAVAYHQLPRETQIATPHPTLEFSSALYPHHPTETHISTHPLPLTLESTTAPYNQHPTVTHTQTPTLLPTLDSPYTHYQQPPTETHISAHPPFVTLDSPSTSYHQLPDDQPMTAESAEQEKNVRLLRLFILASRLAEAVHRITFTDNDGGRY